MKSSLFRESVLYYNEGKVWYLELSCDKINSGEDLRDYVEFYLENICDQVCEEKVYKCMLLEVMFFNDESWRFEYPCDCTNILNKVFEEFQSRKDKNLSIKVKINQVDVFSDDWNWPF